MSDRLKHAKNGENSERDAVMERVRRRLQYMRYCYHSLIDNTLSDDPIDVCLESLLVPIGKASEKTMVRFAILFIPFVHALVLSTAHVYLIDLTGYWSNWSVWLGIYILIQILFNYNCACFTNPGYVSRVKPRFLPADLPQCKKCPARRPPRTHHCSSCGQCVLRMDHHCPWIWNCVGFNNYRYFFNFCLFSSLGIWFVLLSLMPFYVSLRQYHQPESIYQYLPKSDISSTLTKVQEFRVETAFAFCCFVVIPISALTGFHVFLITTGQSSIERLVNKKTKLRPYDKGAWRNWKEHFGIRSKSDFLIRVIMPSFHQPIHNGIHWTKTTTSSSLTKAHYYSV